MSVAPGRIKPKEIAERLGMSINTVYALLEERRIPSYKRGRCYLIPRHAYMEWEKNFCAPEMARLQAMPPMMARPA
jgi:excisionase family DNA binding protein